jgi:hypothetical protein
MNAHRRLATAITAVLLASTAAQASDQFSFPSSSGALIAASAPPSTFVEQASVASAEANGVAPSLGGSITATSTSASNVPAARLPLGQVYRRDTYVGRSQAADAYAYHFLTRALASSSFGQYAADYYRLFTPGAAVSTWTERMAGVVDAGYGGAIDGWTAGAYYLAKLRGPARRRETAPDLSTMPTFRAHPELEQPPTFLQGN